jgi:hypothetical protein
VVSKNLSRGLGKGIVQDRHPLNGDPVSPVKQTRLNHLADHPQELMLGDIARHLSLNRVSISKYLATIVARSDLHMLVLIAALQPARDSSAASTPSAWTHKK